MTSNESVEWILYHHDGRMNTIKQSDLRIDSFTMMDEGIAICQVKDDWGKILDEKYFFMTCDRKLFQWADFADKYSVPKSF